jgi:hypothetical protein
MNPAAAVVAAWTVPGPVPEIHYRRRNELLRDWPALARALHVLANTDTRDHRDTLDDLNDRIMSALDALAERNPAAAQHHLRTALRLYQADLARSRA